MLRTTKHVVAKADPYIVRLRTFLGTPRARQIVLGLFILQAVILVFATRIGTPPDETNHIKFIEYYAHHSLSPIFTDQKPTYNLGDKTRELDYLYHYTMSFVYRLVPFSIATKYSAIRLFSVATGLASLVILAKIGKRIGLSDAVITCSLLLLSNLPMVLMMSSAINNDAAVWLGMLLGILLLLRLWERPTLLNLLLLAALSVAGGMVKRTLLPLGLLFGLVGLLVLIRNFRPMFSELKHFNWRLGLAIALVLISSGLFTERAIGNLVRYHTVTPSCEQVDDTASCAVFWVNVRAQGLGSQQVSHAAILPLPVFAGPWFTTSLYDIIDIQTQAWRHEVKPADWAAVFLICSLCIGVLYGLYYEFKDRRYRSDQRSRWRLGVLCISCAFIGTHLLYNYLDYRSHRVFGLGLNGRYLLPSILPITALAVFYWSKLLARHPRWLTALALVAIAAVILGSGLLMMLRNPQLRLG